MNEYHAVVIDGSLSSFLIWKDSQTKLQFSSCGNGLVFREPLDEIDNLTLVNGLRGYDVPSGSDKVCMNPYPPSWLTISVSRKRVEWSRESSTRWASIDHAHTWGNSCIGVTKNMQGGCSDGCFVKTLVRLHPRDKPTNQDGKFEARYISLSVHWRMVSLDHDRKKGRHYCP